MVFTKPFRCHLIKNRQFFKFLFIEFNPEGFNPE